MKPQFLLTFLGFAFLLGGCATSNVAQVGQDTYLISRSSPAGAFSNLSALQTRVIQDANNFASKSGKVVIPLASNLNQPPVGFPWFDYKFLAVTPQEAQRIAALQSRQREEQAKAWNSLTPAQRIEYTLRLQELQQRDRALSASVYQTQSANLQSAMDRNSYDQRTRALQQPSTVNVNVNGNVSHTVNGSIGIYGY